MFKPSAGKESSQIQIFTITTLVTHLNTTPRVQVTDHLTVQSIPQQVIQNSASSPSLHLTKEKAIALRNQYWSYTKSL